MTTCLCLPVFMSVILHNKKLMNCAFRTFRNDCPMEIKAVATKDGSHLDLIATEETHNHEVDKVFIQCN